MRFFPFFRKKKLTFLILKSEFHLLVLVSLSRGFRLLLSSYGRFFVKFLLAKIADNAVAGTLSLETAQRAFNVFVLSDFYRRHSFLTFLCRPRLIFTFSIIAISSLSVKPFYAVFSPFSKIDAKNLFPTYFAHTVISPSAVPSVFPFRFPQISACFPPARVRIGIRAYIDFHPGFAPERQNPRLYKISFR